MTSPLRVHQSLKFFATSSLQRDFLSRHRQESEPDQRSGGVLSGLRSGQTPCSRTVLPRKTGSRRHKMSAAFRQNLPPLQGVPGASSKKKDTGTFKIVAMCCNRLAPIRLVPFSYFWICWKVMPKAFTQFFLTHAKHHPPEANTATNVNINRIRRLLTGHLRRSFLFLRRMSACFPLHKLPTKSPHKVL